MNKNSLIDIGANLAHDSFDDDRDAVLRRAAEAGVSRIVVTGSSDDSNRKAAELARDHPGVLYSTAGVHPHHASDYTQESDALIRRLAAEHRIVAVGNAIKADLVSRGIPAEKIHKRGELTVMERLEKLLRGIADQLDITIQALEVMPEQVPLFVEVGEIVKVNTKTGDYLGRVSR